MASKKEETEFFKRLRLLMSNKGINQANLSKATNIDKGTISRWRNESNPPSLGSIYKICDFTGCSLEWLRAGKGRMFSEGTGSGDPNLIGNGSIMAGGDIKGSLNGTQPASGKNTIDLDDDEKELILKLRDVGGKRILRKFISELDRIKKIIDEEI